ncbi:MAG: hypothetical protein OXC13_15310 [Caldilineaceae bacterium]|nr:hypothetical protein [Caldilineaceae bacterium]
MSSASLPALTDRQLCRLLELEGWEYGRTSQHGFFMRKRDAQGYRHAVIPDKPLPKRLLGRILSSKQSGIGRNGLRTMIDKHGLR